jgi:hypothetical protein
MITIQVKDMKNKMEKVFRIKNIKKCNIVVQYTVITRTQVSPRKGRDLQRTNSRGVKNKIKTTSTSPLSQDEYANSEGSLSGDYKETLSERHAKVQEMFEFSREIEHIFTEVYTFCLNNCNKTSSKASFEKDIKKYEKYVILIK